LPTALSPSIDKSSGLPTALSPSVDKSSGFPTALSPNVDKSSGYPTAKSPTPSIASLSASLSSTDLCPPVDASQVPRRDRYFSNNSSGREQSPPKSPFVSRFSPSISRSSSNNSLSTCRSPGLVTQPSSRPQSPLICRSRTNSSNLRSFPSNPSLPRVQPSQDTGVDKITVESSDEEDVVVSTTTFEVDNAVVDPASGTKRRKMKPKKIMLNGEIVWKKQ
uniref:Uncharacterized protein n=1 Tax=Panagrolaimus sp. JU765 TaxID=591449 RepID=A0AC34RBD8_9BILA